MKEYNPLAKYRGELRNKNPQERVDFYYGKLADDLAVEVVNAEMARQQVDNAKLRDIVDTCASISQQGSYEKKLIQRDRRGLKIEKHRQSIDLGIAGLLRIDTVHNRSMAKRTNGETRQNHLSIAKSAHRRHKNVERTTNIIHKTIHGSQIIWGAETTQDIVGVKILEGSILEALSIIDNTIIETLDLLNTCDNNELIPAIQSSLGVLHYRRSKASREIADLDQGLKYIIKANNVLPNWHRTATVAWYLLKGSIAFKDQPISIRLRGLKNSIITLAKTFIKDSRSTLIAIKQSAQGG